MGSRIKLNHHRKVCKFSIKSCIRFRKVENLAILVNLAILMILMILAILVILVILANLMNLLNLVILVNLVNLALRPCDHATAY